LFVGGAHGTLPGMIFGSAFCTLGQFLYNEFGVQRLKFISRRYPVPSSRPPPSTVSELSEPPAPKKPAFDRLIHAIGLKKLSDEEYLAQMREERATYIRRIAELEAQLEADRDLKHP
jgi:hypothetical protein